MDPSRFQQKPKLVFFASFIIFILAIIGLIACFSAPWYAIEFGDSKEAYYYGDFDDDFEEEMGSDEFDDYYHNNANMAVAGFFFVIILSLIIIYDERTDKISSYFGSRFFKFKSLEDFKISKPATVVILLLLLILPLSVGTLGGARFVGLVVNQQASFDSTDYGGDEPQQYANFGSTAGYITFIIGFIVFFISLFLIMKLLPRVKLKEDPIERRFNYSKKISKLALLFLILGVIGLITVPVLSFVREEYKIDYKSDYSEFNADYEHTFYMNDGIIHVIGESGAGGRADDIIEDIDRDIQIISISLFFILLISILSLLGVVFYRLDKFPKGSHYLMGSGILIIFISIILIIGFGLVAFDVKALDEEFQREYADIDSDYVEIDFTAKMGYNYIPLIFSFFFIIIGYYYTVAVWPLSAPLIIGEKRAAKISQSFAKPVVRKSIAVIILVIIVVIAGTGTYVFALSSDDEGKKDEGQPVEENYEDLNLMSHSDAMNGYTGEGNSESFDYGFNNDQYIREMTLVLQWVDEPDSTRRHENQPDTFMLQLQSPDGQYFESDEVSNDPSSKTGQITLDTGEFDPPCLWEYRDDEEIYNTWVITVVCINCGDHEANFGALVFTDGGNNWDLVLTAEYYDGTITEEGAE